MGIKDTNYYIYCLSKSKYEMLYIRKSAIYLMNRLLKRLIKPWTGKMSKCYYCSLWVMNYGAGAWSHGKSASIWWLCKSEWCLNAGVVGLFYDWCLNSCLSVEYLRLSLSESHFENVFAWAASSVGYAGFSLDFRWFSFEC